MAKKYVCPKCDIDYETNESNPYCPGCTAQNKREGKNEKVYLKEK